MSDPPAATPPPASSNAGRYLFMFLLGLVLGSVAVVMGWRALEARKTWQDRYPPATMHLFQAHTAQLQQLAKAHRCTAADTLIHLEMLRHLGNELEPAFAELGNDRRFVEHAAQLRAVLDQALTVPPQQCEQLASVQADIGAACKACHQDFR